MCRSGQVRLGWVVFGYGTTTDHARGTGTGRVELGFAIVQHGSCRLVGEKKKVGRATARCQRAGCCFPPAGSSSFSDAYQ